MRTDRPIIFTTGLAEVQLCSASSSPFTLIHLNRSRAPQKVFQLLFALEEKDLKTVSLILITALTSGV